MIQRKPLFGLLGLLVAGMVAQAAPAWANVYASGLSKTGDKSLNYTLNEDATTGVSVQVWQVGGGVVYSENLGAQTKGVHNWTWNGNGGQDGKTYTVKVVASSTGYSSWTKTSVDGALNSFYSPKGVAVNRNQNSQYFGRVYVSEGAGGSTASRTTQDGIYMLNADLSDAIGQGSTAKTGGVTWASSSSSPFRMEVGPDDSVYVCDWADTHSGLWMGDGNFDSVAAVLDNTGLNGDGMNATHGSISGFVVSGTGSSRKIYTVDEDLDSANEGSIWRYDIGTGTVFTGAPSAKVYDDAANGDLILNSNNDIIQANDGTFWVTQPRAGGSADTLLSLMQVSADGKSVLWSSVPQLAAHSDVDPLKRTYGIAYDPVNDMIALATYNSGQVLIFDPNTKSIVSSFTTVASANNRDLAFDAAGNLYVVDNTNERLWAYSPSGANSYTTQSWFTFNGVPEPSSFAALLLGLPGLYLIRRRKH